MQVTQGTNKKQVRTTVNISAENNRRLTRLTGQIQAETGFEISKEALLGELISEKFEKIFGKEAE